MRKTLVSALVVALSLLAFTSATSAKMVLKTYVKGYGYAYRYCHKDGKSYLAVSQIVLCTNSEGKSVARGLTDQLVAQGFKTGSASFSNRFTTISEASAKRDQQIGRAADKDGILKITVPGWGD